MTRQKERLHRVVVIGATPEGIAATNKLGELGIPVTLIDSAPDINKKLASDVYRMSSGLTFNYAHRPGLIRIMRNSGIRTLLPAKVTNIKHTPQGFRVRVDQEQTFVNPDRCTLCGKCVEMCPVESEDDGKAMRLGSRTSLPGRAYIDKRRKPLCQDSCPLGVNAQGYIALAKLGKYQEALSLIRRDNVLPGICGRVCTHPCEDVCRRGDLDEPVSIRAIKRFLTDYEVDDPARIERFKEQLQQEAQATVTRSEKIAIVGSGPAGVAAAADLARKGYQVTVLEKEKETGGVLRYGIGVHRLPRAILDQELAFIEKMGVTFLTDHPVDFVGGLEELKKKYDGVIVATGTWNDRKLGAEGEDLQGVEGCLSFLARRYWENITELKEKVAVIGDGNAAFDLARTLTRIGAEVSLLSWFPKEMIPADKDEIREALEEGISIVDCSQVTKFKGQDGKVQTLECMKTVPGKEDENGIAWPVIADDAEPFELEFDRAFVAIGQAGGFAQEKEAQGFGVSERGFIDVDETMQTSMEGVYAVGDAVTGPSSVVQAMASGRHAAQVVHQRFGNVEEEISLATVRPEEKDFQAIPTGMPCVRRPEMAERHPAERSKNFEEVVLGLTLPQVEAESERCLQCGVCSECLQCLDACGAVNAVNHAQVKESSTEHGGIVIVADPEMSPHIKGEDVIRAYGPKSARSDVNDRIVRGFAAAAKAMIMLGGALQRPKGHGLAFAIPDAGLADELRIGVFVCRCNDSHGWLDDMNDYMDSMEGKDSSIVHVETIASACVKEGSASIIKAVREKGITRIVLASCVCCPLNFVCSGCTDQRSRLKDNLFRGTGISRSMVETCNLRGEILRLIEDKPELALERFQGLLDRSVRRAKNLKPLPAVDRNYNFTAAVIGNSEATIHSAESLGDADLEVFRFGTKEQPLVDTVDHANIHNFQGLNVRAISGTTGDFEIEVESGDFRQIMRVGTVILGEKARKHIRYKHQECLPAHTITSLVQEKGVPGVPFVYPCATSVPGLFLAEPKGINVSKLKKGAAAAVMAAAVMPRGPRQSKGFTVVVDEDICRGCGRCAEVCPYHAVMLQQNHVDGWNAFVDEALCKGCGNCISVCPTNAADSPYRNRAFLEQTLEELLT